MRRSDDTHIYKSSFLQIGVTQSSQPFDVLGPHNSLNKVTPFLGLTVLLRTGGIKNTKIFAKITSFLATEPSLIADSSNCSWNDNILRRNFVNQMLIYATHLSFKLQLSLKRKKDTFSVQVCKKVLENRKAFLALFFKTLNPICFLQFGINC